MRNLCHQLVIPSFTTVIPLDQLQPKHDKIRLLSRVKLQGGRLGMDRTQQHLRLQCITQNHTASTKVRARAHTQAQAMQHTKHPTIRLKLTRAVQLTKYPETNCNPRLLFHIHTLLTQPIWLLKTRLMLHLVPATTPRLIHRGPLRSTVISQRAAKHNTCRQRTVMPTYTKTTVEHLALVGLQILALVEANNNMNHRGAGSKCFRFRYVKPGLGLRLTGASYYKCPMI